MRIGKLEAASRQLDAAIRLFFSSGDPVVIHALTSAAGNVFADVVESKNGESWRTRLQESTELPMSEVKRLLNEAWNFFKHADRDPDATLDFKVEETKELMFLAVLDCGDLQARTCPMEAFMLWYIAVHSERFPLKDAPFSDAVNAFPGIGELPREEQNRLGAEFLLEHCGGSN